MKKKKFFLSFEISNFVILQLVLLKKAKIKKKYAQKFILCRKFALYLCREIKNEKLY